MSKRNDELREEARRTFEQLNHPDSLTRQLADWRRGNPANPPPRVREEIDKLSKASEEAMKQLDPDMRNRFANGD